ncbi:MAG TPA: cell envelope integrity protein CreD [Chitinophagales bacterium]|nr:cell envelope integrity protein CreD [Chitinophagales bacterium]
MNHTSNPDRQIALYTKAAIVTALVLLMMIPMLMINSLVRERAERQQEATDEVSTKWGGAQTVTGPIVSIPYLHYASKSTTTPQRRYFHILPDKLKVNGELLPEKRNRNLFDVIVYNSSVAVTGSFSNLTMDTPNIPVENILFDEAFVTVGITDLRGIDEQVMLKWNGETKAFLSGVESADVVRSGISTPITLSPNDPTAPKTYEFAFNLSLKGSQQLHFVPVGKQTDVSFTSPWRDPQFEGSFLPVSREVNKHGFTARWKVQDLNRSFPQRWNDRHTDLSSAAFGINLITPVDGYMKTHRAVKYAVLFVGLTFMLFFFLELKTNLMIHPLQYVLIGLALCLFYLLLLSISEHLGYNAAYTIASLMTIGLIGFYADGVLKERKFSMLVTGTLVILYSFIFTVIQLQDYSLLMGSLGLFFTLAAVMYFSRNINWYKRDELAMQR